MHVSSKEFFEIQTIGLGFGLGLVLGSGGGRGSRGGGSGGDCRRTLVGAELF